MYVENGGKNLMPRNKYPEETVQKILDVSLKLFIEKGYEQTTILDIIDNLGGLTRGAFYHHFKSKEEVLNALSGKLFYDNNPFDKVKKETTLSGLQKIKKVIMLQQDNKEYMDINIASIPLLKNPRFLAELVENNQRLSGELLQPLIEEGIADGSIKNINANALAELVLLLTNFWIIPSVYSCTKQEFLDKVTLIKSIFDTIGFPLFDSEVMECILGMIENLNLV